MTIWFTSDHHYFHEAVIRYCNRPFKTAEEMNEAMIEKWNSRVVRGDTVYHIGDFALPRRVPGKTKRELVEDVVRRLNGQIHLIYGNHDHEDVRKAKGFAEVVPYKEISVGEQKICLFHFPMLSWHKMHYGSWDLHGHCFDLKTEVLTLDGWKSRVEIGNNDRAATLNLKTGKVEYQRIQNIVDVLWSGETVNLDARNVDGRFTPEHVFIYSSKRKGQLFSKGLASDFKLRTNRRIPLCGQSSCKEYPISDNLLRLYIWMVADGSLENTTLVRFHLRKQRKINYLSSLLRKMKIRFSENVQSSGTTKINFTMPVELNKFSIKPLDGFVMKLSDRQAEIVMDEYERTDGSRLSKKSVQISTSKDSEANLLQAFFVTHGYTCNLIRRIREIGAKRYITYVLSTNEKKLWQTTKSWKNVRVENVVDEKFWCLKVKNKTLFIRRNGKVHVTGNSHGSLPRDYKARRLDVGVDCHNYAPISFEEVAKEMEKHRFVPVDHHGEKPPQMEVEGDEGPGPAPE